MIVWLSSYPKSGNTLLRSMLSAYFFSNDGMFNFKNLYSISQFPLLKHFSPLGVDVNNDKEVFKNFINAQNFINQDKKVKFFKTHSALCKIHDHNFTNIQNTLCVIYIVRDPRNIVASMAHHYDLSIDEATEIIIDKKKFLSKTDKNCSVLVGSWNFNFNSWKNFQQQKKYLLIKYEDLITKKKTVFLRILKFLNSLGMKFEIDIIKLNKVIKTTEFEKMKKKEQIENFSEAMIDKKTGKRKIFFNLGPKNDWKKNLDLKNKDKIEKTFNKEMKELGYL